MKRNEKQRRVNKLVAKTLTDNRQSGLLNVLKKLNSVHLWDMDFCDYKVKSSFFSSEWTLENPLPFHNGQLGKKRKWKDCYLEELMIIAPNTKQGITKVLPSYLHVAFLKYPSHNTVACGIIIHNQNIELLRKVLGFHWFNGPGDYIIHAGQNC